MTFLETVCPHLGLKAIVSGKGKEFKHYFGEKFRTGVIEQIANRDEQVYFALSGYRQVEDEDRVRRKASNVVAVRSLWLDIDAGEEKFAKHGNKVYRTQREALTAVVHACNMALPFPTYMVSSGQGLHVYWSFDQDLTPEEWTQLARWFKVSIDALGIKQDMSKTSDIATILRIPGTMHKSGEMVEVLGGTEQQMPISTMVDALTALGVPMPADKVTRDESDKSEFPPTDFINVANKSISGMGCKQVADLLRNKGNVEEPLWRAGLSIVNACDNTQEEKIEFITAMSNGHPAFDLGEALEKAQATKGPYSCEAFNNINPDGCQGCVYKNSTAIYNPIQTGLSETITRKERTAALEGGVKVAASLQLPTFGGENFSPEMPTGEATFADLPSFITPPKPVEERYAHFQDPQHNIMFTREGTEFRKGKYRISDKGVPELINNRPSTHGVTAIRNKAIKNKDTGEEEWVKEATVFCDVTIYTYDRISDTGKGSEKEMNWMHIEAPFDKLSDLSVSLADIAVGGDGLKRILASRGIALGKPHYLPIMVEYLTGWSNHLREIEEARPAARTMGWTDYGTFVLGEKEYTADSVLDMPVSSENERWKELGLVKGNHSEWSKIVADMYPNGTEGVEAYQFNVLAGFAAPLYSVMMNGPELGGVINFWSSSSGSGKSTAQRVAASIYGRTDLLITSKTSTENAKIQLMGSANSLPIIFDEMTTSDYKQLGEFVYMSTQGRGKERMTDGGNSLRQNNTVWRSFQLSNANKSIAETITTQYAQADGQAMRVIDIEAPSISDGRDNLRDFAGELALHTGSAGHTWISALVANRETYIGRATAELHQFKVSSTNKYNPSERYWYSIISSIIATGEITKELGLHNFDMQAMRTWAYELLNRLRGYVSANVQSPEGMLADFVNEFQSNIVWMKGDTVPDYDIPAKDICGRVDSNKDMMWVSTRHLKSYCQKYNFSYQRVEQVILEAGGEKTQKRLLGKTSRSKACAPVKVLMVSLSKSGINGLFKDEDR